METTTKTKDNTIKKIVLGAVAGVVIGICLAVSINIGYGMGRMDTILEHESIEMERHMGDLTFELIVTKDGVVQE